MCRRAVEQRTLKHSLSQSTELGLGGDKCYSSNQTAAFCDGSGANLAQVSHGLSQKKKLFGFFGHVHGHFAKDKSGKTS